MKYYKISENQLLDLLESDLKLQVLENDGVDNWEWYMAGLRDFLKECFGEMDVELLNEALDNYELSLHDVALQDINEFELIGEDNE